MEQFRRRRFLRDSLALAALSLCSGCGAFPVPWAPAKIPRIGYLGEDTRDGANTAAFLQRLTELGYTDGHNIVIAWRFAEGQVERLPQLAAELVALPVDLLVSSGPAATPAAKHAAAAQPIVMCYGGDPVGVGLIASLGQPGGNITGVAALTSELTTKRLELFAAALPGVTRVAVLREPTASSADRTRLDAAADILKLRLQWLEVQRPEDFPAAFAAAINEQAAGVFVTEHGLFSANRQQLTELAARSGLPLTAGGGRSRDFAAAGALLTYAANFPAMHRVAANDVDKILQGANPADVPVEQPTTFDFIINLKSAQALGLTIPQSVLQQATEIIP